MNTDPLILALYAAALGQALIALLNLRLVALLKWESDLARMPQLMREVFHVHAWFISLTLALFATLTFRFAPELTALALGRWLACGIAAFWGIRLAIQFGYYSSSHWRGQPARLVVHLILIFVYGGFALVYALAGLGGVR